jgi:ORF6N domain
MTKLPTDSSPVPERVVGAILFLRGQRVILDSDLADLYGVPVRSLLQAVKRNLDRFPADFLFQLKKQEITRLRSQIVISNGRGGRRYAPYAFTEQGVAMLSSVLRSKRAVLVNIEIMRAFVHLRRMLASNAALARKLSEMEAKYDEQFRVVFDAIRELMAIPEAGPRKQIGFVSSD